MKKTYEIAGLDCANCAAKLERAFSNIEEVDKATIDFMNLLFHLETKEENLPSVLLKIKETIERIEPGVTLSDKSISNKSGKGSANQSNHNHDHDHSHDHGHGDCCGHDHSSCSGQTPDQTDKDTLLSRLIAKKPQINMALGVITLILGSLTQDTLSFILFLAAYLFIGRDILWKALRNIIKGKVFDENFLMSIATLGAFFIGEYSEGVAVMLLYQIGEMFQNYAVGKSRKSISQLMDIKPEFANKLVDGQIVTVDPEDVSIGDVILVKAGEKIPLDGIILDGNSTIDTAALTGESLPREVESGNSILNGCINLTGVLTIQVEKEYQDSTVAKILDLVENASSKKAHAENFITKFARYYTPVVVIIAALLAIIPSILIPGAEFSDWLYRALVFLVISCPCALVISVPLSFFGGIGGASKCGVLIKGSNYLEALANAKIVVFDKTGTLTKGNFTVTKVAPVLISKEELLEIAAYAESTSNHPISKALLASYKENIDHSKIGAVQEIAGKGIKALIDGKTIHAGNSKLMNEIGVSYLEDNSIGTIIHVSIDNTYAGFIVISDEIKADSKQAIANLKSIGIRKTVMLTGDRKEVGEQTATILNLDEVHTDLLPGDKVEQIELLLHQKQGKEQLVFVGDGLNDAPVLARADIGIAMGGMGSDSAIEAADIVIMTDEPSKIAAAIGISKKTLTIVRQNIIFALSIKLIVLILGAAGMADMWAAIFSDVGVSILAILNAIRALNVKKYMY